ncbi:DNA primase [Propionicicella superfundia]|uniref:DNA primase n=1 Tax=Propionicicella superfundia TaxID=348582 RepID=UPI001B7FD6F4|nr:DNA primase [Propionicicella superfundia]
MARLCCVAGRINDEDVAAVRERARIEDVVSSHVTLRGAGSGTLKGLCPFHEEKTPSFQVTPARGLYYCFGCGEGGDVITFVQRIDNLSFAEAVELLADRVGIQLRYDDAGPRVEPGARMRVLEANQAAMEFFQELLLSPEALPARQQLAGRGFDRDVAERFGVGYAPRGGRLLRTHLRAKGFSDEEMVRAGLVRESGYDFFQGRLLWPIKDAGRLVLGFGGRRLFDDDRMPAKYINTPETLVYKKSHVLYGLDLARTAIGKKSQAVVVEGYTDVMACHVAGVDTAVASCGTAFGADHAKLLQRLMGDHEAFGGEVIFTFDGDAAGQAAALKVFKEDRFFIGQTYVAVEPSGLDPCDLREQQGDAALRELIGTRRPLYRFVLANTISKFDLDRADGRVAALREAAPLVGSIRDDAVASGYARELAGMVGLDPDEVRAEVARVRRGGRRRDADPVEPADGGLPLRTLPDPRDRALAVERGTLKLMLQAPEVFGGDGAAAWDGVTADDFTHPAYRAVFVALSTAERAGNWSEAVRRAAADEVLDQLIVALGVEAVLREPSSGYAREYAARLRLLAVMRQIAELKSRLQRTNPVEDTTRYNRLFSELLELEERRRDLYQESSSLTE